MNFDQSELDQELLITNTKDDIDNVGKLDAWTLEDFDDLVPLDRIYH